MNILNSGNDEANSLSHENCISNGRDFDAERCENLVLLLFYLCFDSFQRLNSSHLKLSFMQRGTTFFIRCSQTLSR